MIKIYYCHQGLCINQCKVLVSNPISMCVRPSICLYHNVDNDENFEPIWKEESYVENILKEKRDYKMEKPEIIFNCKECKEEMVVVGSDEDGVWWVHCMNDNCKQCGKNSIIMAYKENAQEIAEDWLISKFIEYDWRKKDSIKWLDSIWIEYNQYLYDNQ